MDNLPNTSTPISKNQLLAHWSHLVNILNKSPLTITLQDADILKETLEMVANIIKKYEE